MKRILLVNRTKGPERSELITSERRTGEILFTQFPTLEWAGYVIVEGLGKKAVNWIIPDYIFNSVCEFARAFNSDLYEIRVFQDGKSSTGGACEVRII